MNLIEEEDEMSRMRVYSWGAGFIAAILTIIMAWVTLDLPRWAFISEVKASSDRLERQISNLVKSVDRISGFNIDTRSLLLNQEWWRLQRQIEIYQNNVQDDPTRELVRRLKQNQANIKRQLVALRVAASNQFLPLSERP